MTVLPNFVFALFLVFLFNVFQFCYCFISCYFLLFCCFLLFSFFLSSIFFLVFDHLLCRKLLCRQLRLPGHFSYSWPFRHINRQRQRESLDTSTLVHRTRTIIIHCKWIILCLWRSRSHLLCGIRASGRVGAIASWIPEIWIPILITDSNPSSCVQQASFVRTLWQSGWSKPACVGHCA